MVLYQQNLNRVKTSDNIYYVKLCKFYNTFFGCPVSYKPSYFISGVTYKSSEAITAFNHYF